MKQSQIDKNWFIVFSVMFIFGIVWAMIGDSSAKIVFAALSFGLFLHSGIKMELNARHAAHSEGAHH
ncbi:hypothetical protein [Sulfurimonas sp. HSL-1716]|uniref:hypothetical protein n=1 Tax=Hydrocurvibacter sulfurireducens TaxID=3131937 RepID=UPI0031F8B5DA